MFKLKQNEAEARARLRAFWRGGFLGDRPALLATARNPAFAPEPWSGPAPTRKEADFNPDWQAWSQCNALRSRVWLAEAMPSAPLNIGGWLAVLAVLSGGDYKYEGSAWILPRENVLGAPVPEFDPEGAVARKIAACCERIADAVGGDGHVSPPVMLDALTTLSMFMGQEELCVALAERPEDVKRWTRGATALYTAAVGYFYGLLGGRGHSGSTTWLGVMSEGMMEAVQCDFAVMLSPEMFAEFVMPDLCATTAFLDDSIYHLDGVEQMRFIGQIASAPKIRAIQWNPAKHPADISEHMPHFRRIRELGLSLMVTAPGSIDNAVRLTRELGSDGLCISLPFFEREEDALEAIRRIEAR